jgi:hypothetical protein
VITGVLRNTAQTYSVAARNSSGTSAFVSAAAFTKTRIPCPAPTIQSVSSTSAAIQVRFTLPKSDERGTYKNTNNTPLRVRCVCTPLVNDVPSATFTTLMLDTTNETVEYELEVPGLTNHVYRCSSVECLAGPITNSLPSTNPARSTVDLLPSLAPGALRNVVEISPAVEECLVG